MDPPWAVPQSPHGADSPIDRELAKKYFDSIIFIRLHGQQLPELCLR